MGFNKRYLSEDSIRSNAKSNADSFHWFQRYMVYADAYIIDMTNGDWASKIHNQFCEAESDSIERRELHQKIVNNEI
jgi:hypothetical protein